MFSSFLNRVERESLSNPETHNAARSAWSLRLGDYTFQVRRQLADGQNSRTFLGKATSTYPAGLRQQRAILTVFKRGDYATRIASRMELAATNDVKCPTILAASDRIRPLDISILLTEWVDGHSLIYRLATSPSESGRIMGEQHAAIHSIKFPQEPRQTNEPSPMRFDREKFRIGESVEATSLESRRSTLVNALVHRDLHPGNILMSTEGPVVIDWTDSTAGDPVQDVARTLVTCRIARALHPKATAALQPQLYTFLRNYVAEYTGIHPIDATHLTQAYKAELSEAIRIASRNAFTGAAGKSHSKEVAILSRLTNGGINSDSILREALNALR